MSDMDTEALRTIADAVVAIRGMLERQAHPAVTVKFESALSGEKLDGTIERAFAQARHQTSAGPLLSTGETADRDAIGSEVAECLAEYLAVSYSPEQPSTDMTGHIVERILDACGVTSAPTPTASPSPRQPVDLGTLGLGAVVLERSAHFSLPMIWVRAAIAGEPAWVGAYPGTAGIGAIRARTASLGCDDAALQVLHPGITLAGEGS